MNKGQILRIEQLLNGECFEQYNREDHIYYAFKDSKNNIIFIEMRKRANKKKMLPKWEICTNKIDCWVGYDDVREVMDHIVEHTNGVEYPCTPKAN